MALPFVMKYCEIKCYPILLEQNCFKRCLRVYTTFLIRTVDYFGVLLFRQTKLCILVYIVTNSTSLYKTYVFGTVQKKSLTSSEAGKFVVIMLLCWLF